METANRHIKQFNYFANTLHKSSLIYLEKDLSIACALINRYHRPMTTSKPEDAESSQKNYEITSSKEQNLASV